MLHDFAAPTEAPRADLHVVPRHSVAVAQSRLPVPALVTPFRACELCRHSTVRDGQLVCDSPAARLSGGPEPLAVARSVCGSCGPNARHLDMPTWR